MVYKYCPMCSKTKIEDKEKMCQDCSKKYGNSLDKARYKRYQDNRTDKDSQVFYNSKEWKKVRKKIKKRDKGLCLLCLLNNNLIVSGDLVHHIVEEKEDKMLRLEEDNLLMLCDSCHKYVHREYEKNSLSKIKMQNELKILIQKSKNEFGELNG